MTTKTKDSAHAALVSEVGADRIRQAGQDDAIGGVLPSWVVSVEGTEQVAAALRVATEHDLAVVPRGSGSKIGWGGTAERVDLVLDVSAASGVLEHAAGDLVVRAQAGTPIAEIQRVAGTAGQQLSIDPMWPTATVGGVIATATFGPGRHLHGGVRDLLIGITVVRADGTVTVSGGKVVKNVAGYDLGKLYTGSYGTLGVITEAIFRLHPLADESRWISVTLPDVAAANTAIETVRHSQAMPTAIELNRQRSDGPITMCAHLEGRPETTHERALVLAESVGSDCQVLDEAPDWWGRYPFEAEGIGLRWGADPAALPQLLTAAQEAAGRCGVELTIRGAAGIGVLHAGMPGDTDPAKVAELVGLLRERSDYAVVLTAPPAVREAVDLWGPVSAGLLKLMSRTKDQFDPDHLLAPGRFMGGI